MSAALLLLALGQLARANGLPLPDAPRHAPARPVPVVPGGFVLNAEDSARAFWAPHRLTRAFLYVEVVGAAMALGGSLLLIADANTNGNFEFGRGLLIAGGLVGFTAAPGALTTESIAFSRVPHANPAGLLLGWSGVAMVLISPLFNEPGSDEPLPYLVVGGTVCGLLGTPLQYAADEHAFARLALLPTPNGVAMAGQF